MLRPPRLFSPQLLDYCCETITCSNCHFMQAVQCARCLAYIPPMISMKVHACDKQIPAYFSKIRCARPRRLVDYGLRI